MKKLLNKIFFKFRLILIKKRVIPNIDEKRELIERYRKIYNPTVLVETGTFFGDTVEHFKHKFESVISVELSEELAAKAVSRFAEDKNVHIIHGDSGIVLQSVLEGITGTALFWLDGHYSSEFFIKEEFIRTAKGEMNTPIEKELDLILQSGIESVILIDDARLFTGRDDYPSLRGIKSKVKAYKTKRNVFVNKDIIFILPALK